jgi:hypothetical protein
VAFLTFLLVLWTYFLIVTFNKFWICKVDLSAVCFTSVLKTLTNHKHTVVHRCINPRGSLVEITLTSNWFGCYYQYISCFSFKLSNPSKPDRYLLETSTVHLETRCAHQNVLEVMSRSVDTVKTEFNYYILYQYCTSTAVWQLNTGKQQHTATATSIMPTKYTYCKLIAQRPSELTVN